MTTETSVTVRPILSVFLSSLRDIGYSFETALADLVDNSISANAENIKIYALPSTDKLVIVDDGNGMSDDMLKEAMRLGTQKETRAKNDLGRFGLGLKTASFSQCKRLTVFSKCDQTISGYTWDLDFLSQKDDWLLQKASLDDLKSKLNEMSPQIYGEFSSAKHASLILWEKIDRYSEEEFDEELKNARKHLALTFHRYLGFRDLTVKWLNCILIIQELTRLILLHPKIKIRPDPECRLKPMNTHCLTVQASLLLLTSSRL